MRYFNGYNFIDMEWVCMRYFMILLNNLLRAMLLKKVMERFLLQGSKKGMRQKVGFCVYFLVVSVFYGAFGMSFVYEICNCLGIMALTFLYRETWKKKVWVSMVLFSMDLACFLTAFFAFGNIADWLPQILSVQVLMLLVCVFVILRMVPSGQEDAQSGGREIDFDFDKHGDTRQTYILAGIPATEIFVLGVLLYGRYQGTPAILICISTLFINLGVFYLYHVMRKSYINMRESDIYRQQLYAYQNQLDVIQENQNRIRSLKHDMKNHILSLQMLLQRDDREEAEKYLDSMQEFMANPSEYVTTGNDAIDSLLNYKIQSARERLDAVEAKVNIPEKLMLQSFDLNVILGNLLDNAIDAAMQTEEKKLRMTLKLEKGILFLNLCNSCRGIAEGKKKNLETTKADRENHGMGLNSVRRIVEKYHGDMELSCENGNMEVDIIMYMKDL